MTAHEIFRDPLQGGMFVVCIVFIPICTLTVLLRLLSAGRTGRKLGVEDLLAFGALLFFLAYASMSLAALVIVNGQQVLDLFFQPGGLDTVKLLLKMQFAVEPMFTWNQALAKFSILCLYYRLFSVKRSFVIATYIIGFVQLGVSLGSFFAYIFQCTPVSHAWNPLGEGECRVNTQAFLVGAETFNSGVDFAMIVLAIMMVRDLKVTRDYKYKLAALFVVGGLAGVIGFIKIGIAYNSPTNLQAGIWTIIQMAFSIICCCAPVFKSWIPGLASWSRIFSRLTGSSRGSNSGGSGRNSNKKGSKTSSDRQGGSQDDLHLDAGSTRGISWSNVELAKQNEVPPLPAVYPGVKTVHVQQSVEMV